VACSALQQSGISTPPLLYLLDTVVDSFTLPVRKLSPVSMQQFPNEYVNSKDCFCTAKAAIINLIPIEIAATTPQHAQES
jgi:hypothetical protein